MKKYNKGKNIYMYINVSTIFYQSKIHGKNDFAEESKILLGTDQKIILSEP